MYQPQQPPDASAVSQWAFRELQTVGQQMQADVPFLPLTVLYAAPPRIYGGMLVLADGVKWQPDGVNGEGYYRRNIANSTWKYLG